MTAILMFGPQHAYGGGGGTPMALALLPVLAVALAVAWWAGQRQAH